MLQSFSGKDLFSQMIWSLSKYILKYSHNKVQVTDSFKTTQEEEE